MTPSRQNSGNNDELDLKQFIRDCISRWHYFVIAGIIITCLAFVYIKFTLPVYEASGSVIVQDEKSGSSIEDVLSSDLFGTSLSVPTEIGILKSRQVMRKTIEKLGLGIQYYNTTSVPSQPLYPRSPIVAVVDTIDRHILEQPFDITIVDAGHYIVETEYDDKDIPEFSFTKKAAFGELVKHKYFAFTIRLNDSLPVPEKGTEFRFIVRSINKLSSDMLANLTVEALDKDADIISMRYTDVVPVRALDVLNTIGEVYIDRDVQDKAAVASLTLKFVDEQLNSTGQNLSQTEKEMQTFKERNSTVDLSAESQAMLAKLNDIDIQRVRNKIEANSLDNLYQYVTEHTDLTNLAPTSLGIPDPLLVELIGGMQQLQNKRKSLAYGVKNDAPALKVLDQQIAEMRSTLIENISSIRRRMSVTDQSLKSQLGTYETAVRKVPEVERELIGIKRNFEVNQNIYTYLLQKKAETSIAKATVVSDNKILDNAALADEPVSPNKKLVAVLIALLTLLIPSGIILARNLLRTTVQNKEDITALTNIPVVGVIGHSADVSTLAVMHKPKSAIAEAFRTIRTNLQFYGINNGKKVIMITSSVGGEGKSFITLNLATVLAMQNKKVIVLGLDLRKPKLFNDFQFRNDTGVTSFLAGGAALDSVIRKTTIEGVDLISSGPIPPNPAELLASNKMDEMISELRNRYDYVVIDTPPVGLVSDGLMIVPRADITLYIVRQNYSKLEYIRSLDGLAAEHKISNLSIVLNDSDFSRAGYYGYGHHYGYVNNGSGYYEDGENKKGVSRLIKRRRKKEELN